MELHVVTDVIHLGVETLSLLCVSECVSESHSEGLTDRTKCDNKRFLLIACLVLSAIWKTERS